MYFSRGKNKITNPYTIQDLYLMYLEDCDNELYKVEYNIYRDIMCLYYKGIMDYIFETSLPFKLPYRLGHLQIIKKKVYAGSQTKFPTSIDWTNTIKYDKKIFHLNEHSNGYKYLFTWIREGYAPKNLMSYRFIPTRANKRKLAHYIKNKIKDYFVKR